MPTTLTLRPPLASVTTATNELETAAAAQQEAKQIAKTKTIAQGQKEDTLDPRNLRFNCGLDVSGRQRLRRRLLLWSAPGGCVEIDQASKHCQNYLEIPSELTI